MKKFTIEFCQQTAKEHGGALLTEVYVGANESMLWRCDKCNYVWSTSIHSVRQGKWCPKCAGVVKHTLQWCHDLAAKRGGKCLSTVYKNVISKDMLWECKEGHQWMACADKINQGRWCPVCGGTKRHTIQWCYDLATERGGKCLSTEYNGNQDKNMLWECNEGHRWQTCAASIASGKWCPVCAGYMKKDLRWCQEIAISNGGRCLSSEYKDILHKDMLWECQKGHQWETSASAIGNNGTWCPTCAAGKTQRKLATAIASFFPNETIIPNCRKVNCMINPKTGYTLELDIYLPNLGIAIEYDGEQHFRPIRFNKNISDTQMELDFKDLKYRDKLKTKLTKNGGIKLIRFNYKQKITPELVREVLLQSGVIIPDTISPLQTSEPPERS